ncbi:nickel pincer cofactor biosynthesis protein LarC [Nocardioides flavescens]|uniref:Pyridinium-3,5-bisthiocarboxylic acid mononucleotide nickel insertion protein n=1 Tax=Nocardioides flavescens TaxID=2691959 RepID=A0A6L7EU38_9ACTN|nr:nickel pincer cofactor biosynthesis protein LarC [Nocardioides flavescens]MXG88968.1 nickel pincer cofactor biosynthesis protein LarC [Nocardioides flavescens]
MTPTIWVDASAGASGDMLLGALAGAGVPIAVLQEAVDAVSPEPVTLRVEQVTRAGFAATRVHVEVADSVHHRTWRDVRAMLDAAPATAVAAFERLAVAEGAVHGHDPLDVHFHEVGALDAIADVVGVCAGFTHLGASEVVVSPIAVGSGSVRGAHGVLPVPPPAVTELLRGVPSYAGPGVGEACTPTGAALLATLATSWGPQPALVTDRVGVGAGGRDPDTHANVLRVLVGASTPGTERLQVLEANVDDLDPRVWPAVLEALLAAGARDAWLTPVLMKKGRPAHTLHALVAPGEAEAVRAAFFAQTSTIGVRSTAVDRVALPREEVEVTVDGQVVRVKVTPSTTTPEYDDVLAAARALARPVRDVLAEASARARDAIGSRP